VKTSTRNRILLSAKELAFQPSPLLNGAEIARNSKLARTSIYEYFASADDIFGEVLINELKDFRSEVLQQVSKSQSAVDFISNWVDYNLQYIESGRHLVARRLMPIALNSSLKIEIRTAHTALYSVFHEGCKKHNLEVSEIQMGFINSIIESAAKKIESGLLPLNVKQETTQFILKALSL
jgi:AcrR family transcriptional regulator